MSQRLIQFLLIFPRFLPPVPLLLLLTTAFPLPHRATACPTPPAHLVSPSGALFVFIPLLFTTTSSCIYVLSANHSLSTVPFHHPPCCLFHPSLLLSPAFIIPLISPSPPLVSVPCPFLSSCDECGHVGSVSKPCA